MNCLPPVLLPQRGAEAAAAVVRGAPGRSRAEQSPLAAGSLPTSETSDVRLLSRSSRAEQNLQLRFVPQRLRASETFSSANSSSSLQKTPRPSLARGVCCGFSPNLFFCMRDFQVLFFCVLPDAVLPAAVVSVINQPVIESIWSPPRHPARHSRIRPG